jgi:predicted dehydrogenase
MDDALRDGSTMAVDICLPHNLHAEFAVAAAMAGKHVLVEKPLAHSLEAADRMIDTAQRVGVVLMVAENVRFEPGLIEAAGLVAGGAIGVPALVQITREAYLRESFLRDRPWFLDDAAAAGGIMMSGGIHDFDKLRMIVGPSCGEITEVHGRRARQRFAEMKGDDTSVATVRFANGAVGVLVESFIMKSEPTAGDAEVHWMRTDGDLGSIVVSHDDTRVSVYSEKPGVCEVVDGKPRTRVIERRGDSFRAEIEHFIECVRIGSEPLTSGRRQRRSLELVLAAYESMRTGRPVAV